MIKIGIFTVIAMVLAVSVYSYAKTRYVEAPHITQANRVMKQHAQEMQAEGYALKVKGGGFFQDINVLSIGFYSKDTPTVEEARLVYVRAVERFLALVNNDVAIRPYLHDCPFTIDNLEYSMNFQRLLVGPSGNAPIVFVFSCKGNIVYTVNEPKDETVNPLREVHEEPYSEALRIVREAGIFPNELGGS